MYRYFTEEDFERCAPSCRMSDMDRDFMLMLDKARHLSGVPFRLNSAYRSKAWELAKGRSGNSAHCKGKAVDIRCLSEEERYKIIHSLLLVGFTRIGINGRYIHVDNDSLKRPFVVWMYNK